MNLTNRQAVVDDAYRRVADRLKELALASAGAEVQESAVANAYELVFRGEIEGGLYAAVEHLHKAHKVLSELGELAGPDTVKGYIELARDIMGALEPVQTR